VHDFLSVKNNVQIDDNAAEAESQSKHPKRTQTSMTSHNEVKNGMGLSLKTKMQSSKAKGASGKDATRNKQPQIKSLNSPTSVKSLKLHTLLTDRSERSALTRKQERLNALLLEKKQLDEINNPGMLSDRRKPMLSERDGLHKLTKKSARSSHSKELLFSGLKDKGKFANQYLAMGEKQPDNIEQKEEVPETVAKDAKPALELDLSAPPDASIEKPHEKKKGETKYMEISFSNEPGTNTTA